jgi:hypothetical protein
MRSRYGIRRSTRGRARRVVRRSRPYKAKSSVTQQVFSALTGAALNRLKSKLGLNTELKFVDTPTTTFVLSSAGLVPYAAVTTTPIPQGDSVNQRNGAGFRLTRFHVKGCLYNDTANTIPARVRVIWVNWGKNTAGAASTILQIPTDINSAINTDPAVPFKVVSDKMYHVGVQPAGGLQSGAIPAYQEMDFLYEPLSHHVRWTDADTIGGPLNMIEGQFAQYVMCDAFSVGTPPFIKQYQRIEFVDN